MKPPEPLSKQTNTLFSSKERGGGQLGPQWLVRPLNNYFWCAFSLRKRDNIFKTLYITVYLESGMYLFDIYSYQYYFSKIGAIKIKA